MTTADAKRAIEVVLSCLEETLGFRVGNYAPSHRRLRSLALSRLTMAPSEHGGGDRCEIGDGKPCTCGAGQAPGKERSNV